MAKDRVAQLNGKKGGIGRAIAGLEAAKRPVPQSMRNDYKAAVQELKSLEAAKGSTQITNIAIPKNTSEPSKTKATRASNVDEDKETGLESDDSSVDNAPTVKKESIDTQHQGLFDDTSDLVEPDGNPKPEGDEYCYCEF